MKILLIGSLLLIMSFSMLNARNEGLRPYRLINSDYLTIDYVNNEYRTRLVGNVHFFYGDTEFFADRAELFDFQKTAELMGNVKVIDDSLSLYAKEAKYYRVEEILKLSDDVFIVEEHQDGTKRTFEAGRADYHRDDEKIYAFTDIVFYDEKESVSGKSNYLDYDLNSGYGYITGEPKISLNVEDTLQVKAEKIEFYRDFNRFSATFNVETVYSEYTVNSDFLIFYIDDEYAVFLGQPYLYSDMVEARAERFYLYFKDDKINSATMENNCVIFFSVEEGSEKNNQIESKLVEFVFTDGNITGIKAFQGVNSIYRNDKPNEFMINRAISEELEIVFNDDEIENIFFKGKVSGTYIFSNQNIDKQIQ